jgi:hypothetical protein
MAQTKITSDTIVKAAPEHLASDVDGEAVILNLESGTYYGLNQVGVRIWQLIQQPSQVDAVKQKLIAEYDVDPEVCSRDLVTILTKMLTNNLIEVCKHEQTA